MTLSEFLVKNMPESAEDAAARLVEHYSLGETIATLIANDPPAIGLFEDAVSVALAALAQDEGASSEEYDSVVSASVANYLCNDLYALIKKSATEGLSNSSRSSNHDGEKRPALLSSISVEQSKVDGQQLGLLIAMIVNGTLTTSMGKKILSIMHNEDSTSSPTDIAIANGWEVISDMDVLMKLCENIVHDPNNTKQLEQYKEGGKNTRKIEKFFVGKVMAHSNVNAHPEKLKQALACVLSREISDQ